VHIYLYIYTHILKISHLPGGSLHDGNTRFCIHRLLYTHTHHTHTHKAHINTIWHVRKSFGPHSSKKISFFEILQEPCTQTKRNTLPCFCENTDWRPDNKFLQDQKASFAKFLCKPMKYMLIPVRDMAHSYTRDRTNSRVWQDSFICVTGLIHMCVIGNVHLHDMSYLQLWGKIHGEGKSIPPYRKIKPLN